MSQTCRVLPVGESLHPMSSSHSISVQFGACASGRNDELSSWKVSVSSCERVVYRHGVILLILRVRIGFSARRSRAHGSCSSGQRPSRSERKSRGTRDRGRRQNKETTNAQTCDDMCMNILLWDTCCDTLSHNVMCAQGWKCREIILCEMFLSTLPSVTVDRYRLYTKPTVTKKRAKKMWAHFQLHSDAYHHEELGDDSQYSHPLCWSTRALDK